MTFRYRRYGGPITSTGIQAGELLELWNDDEHYVFTNNEIREHKGLPSFEREYTLKYMGEPIATYVRPAAPFKDIISQLEDVP